MHPFRPTRVFGMCLCMTIVMVTFAGANTAIQDEFFRVRDSLDPITPLVFVPPVLDAHADGVEYDFVKHEYTNHDDCICSSNKTFCQSITFPLPTKIRLAGPVWFREPNTYTLCEIKEWECISTDDTNIEPMFEDYINQWNGTGLDRIRVYYTATEWTVFQRMYNELQCNVSGCGMPPDLIWTDSLFNIDNAISE